MTRQSEMAQDGKRTQQDERYRGGQAGAERVGPLVVVLSGWPRVSETFALNELEALRRRGLLAGIFATKPGDASVVQPLVSTVDPLVQILDDGSPRAQINQVVDAMNGREVGAVHGYFAHRPAEIAAGVAQRLGVPFGFSVHALDVRTVSRDVLADRCAAAAVVVSCNDDAAATLRSVGADPVLLRHGVALDQFGPDPSAEFAVPHRTEPSKPCGVSLLAVGRLIEKKGFPVLLDALAMIDSPVTLRFVGSGADREALEAQIDRLRLAHDIQFIGSRSHDELPAYYRDADIVVVPSIVDSRGDRDGLPNVVLEAMASGKSIVASEVAAIPAAIESGRNGVLVPPGDATALAASLRLLIADPQRRARLGAAARATAEARFALGPCTDAFCDVLVARYQLTYRHPIEGTSPNRRGHHG